MLPAIKTATTSAYTAMIPDMTTGIRDYASGQTNFPMCVRA
jgi:hypothetical protein